jgi:hypothetical protein
VYVKVTEMRNIIAALAAMGLTIFIILVVIGIVVGFACLYYGAILFVLLSILKYFGIIGVMAVA